MKPSGPIVVAVTDSEVRLLALAQTLCDCSSGRCLLSAFELAAIAAQTVLPCGAWKGITQRKFAGHMLSFWEAGGGRLAQPVPPVLHHTVLQACTLRELASLVY